VDHSVVSPWRQRVALKDHPHDGLVVVHGRRKF
jgi:hypothetical protein